MRSPAAPFCYLHEFALLVIFLYCLSYADQWYLNLFGFLDNKRVAHWLNMAFNIAVAVLLFMVIHRGASIISPRFPGHSFSPNALRPAPRRQRGRGL